MGKKYKYHCSECQHCCPFVDENNKGNCDIDMKEIQVDTDRCEKFKLDKLQLLLSNDDFTEKG